MLTSTVIRIPQFSQLIYRHSFVLLRSPQPSQPHLVSRRHYAKPAVGIAGLGKKKLTKTGPTLEKKKLPVETDPVKLVTYCCGSNIYKDGEDIKLKDDSEYPDWLWTLHTGPPKSLDELDPDTDEYWERATSLSKKRWTSLMKVKRIK